MTAANLTELWAQAIREFGDRPVALDGDRTYRYAEVERLIAGVAGGLRERFGVEPGRQVALIVPNCIEFIVAYLAVLRCGAVAVPVNVRLKPEEIRFVLDDAEAALVIAHQATWGAASEAMALLDRALPAVVIGDAPDGATAFADLESGPLLAAEGSPGRAAPPSQPAAIIYTSGTTGRPKGSLITHANVLFNSNSAVRGLGFRPDDVHLLAVPLFHVTGLNTILPTAIRQGAAMAITARADPAELMALCERRGVTTFLGVPTTYILMSQMRAISAEQMRTVRLIGYSGAPMPVRAIGRLREIFPWADLHNFYGLTETTSIATVLPAADALARPDSIGRVVPEVEARICDAAGEALAAGASGELCLRGPNIFAGYWKRPEATAEAFFGDWFGTGDLATMDGDGYIVLRGRAKEMIIVGGENVYPAEVEQVLCQVEGVAEAAVVGIEHAVHGELVKAVVVAHPGAALSELDLKRHCAERLASFKVPRVIEFRDALPRNPSGKVVKREL
jgi:long-chain acyl-CoA synthetase